MDLNLKDRGRFVIVKHEHRDRPVHWDVMFELSSGKLAAFRSDADAEKLAREGGELEKIFDHDEKFLVYEGQVNKGLGCVAICEKGVYESSFTAAESIRLVLSGKFFEGNYDLSFQNGQWLILRV